FFVENRWMSETPWLLPSLTSTLDAPAEPPVKRLRSGSPSIQAVIFDFDGTLTVREEIPGWRIFPERGGFGRQGPDNSWLRERGFGGQDRISHLREMLCDLKRLGVQNRIVSFADRDFSKDLEQV
ncbi:unnamed protein product, partial [Durusdinium trenchii]